MPNGLKDYVMTLNNYSDEEYNNLCTKMGDRNLVQYGVIGKEVGEQGTPHLQMFIQFKRRVTMVAAKRLLGNNRLHMEQRRGTPQEASNYCKKDGEYVEYGELSVKGQRNDLKRMVEAELNKATEEEQLDQFGSGWVQYRRHVKESTKAIINQRNKERIKDSMALDQLRPWQQILYNAVQHHADPRKVLWIWDATGNKGKSYMATYLPVNMNAFVTSNGKSADVKYAYNGEPIVVFDFSRTQQDQINYQVIEEIKNGRYFSSKYVSEMRVFETPHVICFANFEPNRDALSRDRWLIVDLDRENPGILQARLALRHNMELAVPVVHEEMQDEVIYIDSDDEDFAQIVMDDELDFDTIH